MPTAIFNRLFKIKALFRSSFSSVIYMCFLSSGINWRVPTRIRSRSTDAVQGKDSWRFKQKETIIAPFNVPLIGKKSRSADDDGLPFGHKDKSSGNSFEWQALVLWFRKPGKVIMTLTRPHMISQTASSNSKGQNDPWGCGSTVKWTVLHQFFIYWYSNWVCFFFY